MTDGVARAHFHYALIVSIDIPVSTVMSRLDGDTPARTSADPRAAIIAPLSVQ